MKGLAEQKNDSALCFVDISRDAGGDSTYAADRTMLLARFHVQRADGSRLDGAAAFVAMWRRLPGWHWLARLASLPGMLPLMELAYRGFLHLRPVLQAIVRRLDKAPVAALEGGASRRSSYFERELRSDHAGETGAVYIYRGIATVARWRGDLELLSFAERHGATETEHLQLIEALQPSVRRSYLLGPWRVAGWLTGALPAVFGRRAVYGTIAAVETFVDQHYQQQIDHLEQHGDPEGLLHLLRRCQSDERHHRDEAAALIGERAPWLLRTWCALVGFGSAAAVLLARRV